MNKVMGLFFKPLCLRLRSFSSPAKKKKITKHTSMNGASLCNSVLLHSHSLSRFKSSCSFASSPSSSSSVYLISPCFTTSTYISFSHRIRQRFRAVVVKRNDGFRSFAANKQRSSGSGLMESGSSIDDDDGEEEDDDEEEDEDWGEFDLEAEGDGDEDEGEFLPMEKMKKWLEKKPRGFGVGKKYETLIEDKLLDEIEQSWKAQAANLNKLKNDPLKPQLKRDDGQIKGPGETQIGFRVRVTNLPKKKNVHRDLKAALKEVSGILNIAPAVSGNKKTKDPVCKGFALVDFKSEIDANRFVEQFTGQRLSFGKVIKQIKCQLVDFSSNQSASEELRSDTVFEELPFSGLEAVSNADVVVEDAFLDTREESDDSDEEVDEMEVEEDERNGISSSVESPIELRRDLKPDLRSQKQVVKREIREHEELETPLVSFQANKSEEAVGVTTLDDDGELDRADVEEVAEENLEPPNISMSSSDEKRIDRIRRLELKLLGREKLLGGGADTDQLETKPGSIVEGKKKEKMKKKKILVKGKNASKIEIPGSSKRLKVKEKALLTGVLVKYAAKAASTSNDE